MRHFLVDTNVLLDFLSDRKPFSDQAEILFEYKQPQQIEIYVSAISLNNLYYIINKISGHKTAIKL
jgi:predicted nucleic acid-binding protein